MNLETLKYAARCMRWRLSPDLLCCPSCGSSDATEVDRKAWISQLVRCLDCRLLYRRPQAPANFSESFYETEYRSSMTTDLPTPESIGTMLGSSFRDTEKDFSAKIGVLGLLGLKPNARVLDYGSSWGYGVWQLHAAGYDAEGFELSTKRARFGAENLGVTIHTSVSAVPHRTYDAVFSNHVLEHVPNPGSAIKIIEQSLKPGGWFVAFFPNGSDECRRANPARFHCNWGRLHPVYLSDEYCARLLHERPHWMLGKRYESPPDLVSLRQWDGASQWIGDMRENEMMLVVRF